MAKSTYDENWLVKQMAQANPPCWRCGKPGKRCTVEYTRSDRSREKVFCDKCADIVTRQHKYIVKFHAPNTAYTRLETGDAESNSLSKPAVSSG